MQPRMEPQSYCPPDRHDDYEARGSKPSRSGVRGIHEFLATVKSLWGLRLRVVLFVFATPLFANASGTRGYAAANNYAGLQGLRVYL